MHDRNSFLTLTYDEKHLPKDRSLNVEHWKLFAKRLRKSYGPFRFLHCGEYGDENGRPHYHAAIFGHDFMAESIPFKDTEQGEHLYTNPILDKIWGKGLAVFGELTFASAAYVARYIMKKITGEAAEWHYQEIDPITGETWNVKPEYITMSRKPGIGKTWIDKYMDEVYPDDSVIVNGKPSRPPKYYDQQLEQHNATAYRELKKQRSQRSAKQESENTAVRLAIKETVKR